MDERYEGIAIAKRPRDYAGLLWIFGASMLGFSMFCATSAIALSDPSLPTPIVIEARDIPNLAFSNLNTAAALTAQAFADLVEIPTSTPSFTPTATETETTTPTPTSTFTRRPPTNTPTDKPQIVPTIVLPTSTNTPRPTNTAIVVVPHTGTPTVDDPPTETPVPEPPTDTPVPPP